MPLFSHMQDVGFLMKQLLVTVYFYFLMLLPVFKALKRNFSNSRSHSKVKLVFVTRWGIFVFKSHDVLD